MHRHRDHKVFLDRQLVVTPGIHYFDAFRFLNSFAVSLLGPLVKSPVWPGCLASVPGVSWRIVSSLHRVSWQGLWPSWGFFYTILQVLLRCCVSFIKVFILRMILSPFWDSAKALPDPLCAFCVLCSLCPLLPPGSSLLFFSLCSRVWFCVWCFVLPLWSASPP